MCNDGLHSYFKVLLSNHLKNNDILSIKCCKTLCFIRQCGDTFRVTWKIYRSYMHRVLYSGFCVWKIIKIGWFWLRRLKWSCGGFLRQTVLTMCLKHSQDVRNDPNTPHVNSRAILATFQHFRTYNPHTCSI